MRIAYTVIVPAAREKLVEAEVLFDTVRDDDTAAQVIGDVT